MFGCKVAALYCRLLGRSGESEPPSDTDLKLKSVVEGKE